MNLILLVLSVCSVIIYGIMSLTPLNHSISMINQYDNPLLDAIEEGIVDREVPVDPHKCGRRALKVVQISISLAANGSYFPIIFHAGPFFAVGNFVSFFALDYWAVNATLDDALGPRGEREIVLIGRNSKGRVYEVSLTVGAVVLSLLAIAPLALPVLDYDGEYGVPGLVAVFLGGSILPLRSIQLSLNKTIQGMKCVLGETGKKIEAVRSEMVSLVDEYRDLFEQLGMEDKLLFIGQHHAIRGMDGRDSVGKYLSTVLVGANRAPAVEKSRCWQVVDQAGDVIANLPGALLAASLETALAMYTFDKVQGYITSNEVEAGICTAVAIGSGIYLNGKSIVSTTHRFASAIFNGLRCKRVKGLSEQLRPKLSACLKLIGLTFNLGTIGSSLVIYGDFFKDDQFKKHYFEVTLSIAFFVLSATATLDLVDNAVKSIVLRGGDPNEAQVIQLYQELGLLKNLLEKSSLLDFATFVLKCPKEIKDNLVKKVGLSFDELHAYISSLEDVSSLRPLVS